MTRLKARVGVKGKAWVKYVSLGPGPYCDKAEYGRREWTIIGHRAIADHRSSMTRWLKAQVGVKSKAWVKQASLCPRPWTMLRQLGRVR